VAGTKYKQRKLIQFEDAVDKLFNNDIYKPRSGEGDYPWAAAIRGREENALKLVLNMLRNKKPELLTHL
jgi:hypothetical protein